MRLGEQPEAAVLRELTEEVGLVPADVDVVGVTEDGTHVSAIHPRFEVGDDSYFGYFAYQYDPNAPSQTLDIEALDRSTRKKFRGTPR